MRVKAWLKLVADIKPSDLPNDDGMCYYSKFDGSYITRVGMEHQVKALADREITEELTNGVGYSPKDNKWYGWSHRAIYGFTVGSTCKIGDCHYVPDTIEHAIAAAIDFWHDDEFHYNTRAKPLRDGVLLVEWDYNGDVPNEKLRHKLGSVESHYKLGRGEWVAQTMEDAKQMAIDFNEGVS